MVFHRKCVQKRLGHQMYIWCLWRNVAWVSSHLGFIVIVWVSLIAGVGYRVENGME